MLDETKLPIDYVQHFKASVVYMRQRVHGLCWDDDVDDVDEPCVQPEEGIVAECDASKAISCFDYDKLSLEFGMAFSDEEITSACQ